ncbi:P450-derived glycosyltransferase activator [Streptomyces atroolivaceus]|uniref:cytochrome P450 family protein n=1 Tax=Streptomyces atroolivaceus TaxID=66869 RepID=UPI00364E9229
MTRYQIDPRLCSDSDLARHLLTARGVQWMHGERGVPLALLLRGLESDRHALYEEIRRRPGLSSSHVGVWVTAGHPAAAAALSDPRLGARAPGPKPRRNQVFTNDADTTLKHVMTVDDGTLELEHDAYERLARHTGPVLGAAAVEARTRSFGDLFERRADDLTGRFDLMDDYARPGVTAALADVIGLPADARERVEALIADTGPVLDSLLCPPTLRTSRRLVGAYDGVKTALAGVLGAGPATSGAPAGSLLAEVPRLAADDPQAEADVLTAGLLTLVVGTHLASNLVCGTVHALLRHPGQLALVRDDGSLAGAAVEETLRYAPPVRLVSRVAREDLQLAGTEIAAGDQIVVLVEAANCDPAANADPRVFSVERTDGAHVTLDGLPGRFVAPVVRALATEAVRVLMSRVPKLEPEGEPVRHMRSPVTGAIARYPLNAAV